MRVVTALLAVLLALAAAAPAARANGDPPSNVLTRDDLYVPAEPASPAVVARLRSAVRRANEAGYRTKVAVVRSEADLGSLATALNQPQQYADYLVADLRRQARLPAEFALLVVMPVGAGIAGKTFDGGEREAARTIDVSTDATSDDLVRAATPAVERMAAAGGHPIGGAGGSGGGGSSAPLIAGVLGGLVLLAVVFALASRARERAAAEGEKGPRPTKEGGTE